MVKVFTYLISTIHIVLVGWVKRNSTNEPSRASLVRVSKISLFLNVFLNSSFTYDQSVHIFNFYYSHSTFYLNMVKSPLITYIHCEKI